MFGGAPPQQSAAEIKQQEVMAKVTTNFALGLCAVLYISPFVVDYVSNLL